MIHPHTELRHINDTIGYGVFATQKIPRGTIVWTLCQLDGVMTPEKVRHLDPIYYSIISKYAYINQQGNFVLCWDWGRFINHSCEPAILDLGDCEVAIRDILPGEQVTCEYAMLNLWEDLHCSCGARQCRHIISSNDIFHLSAERHDTLKKMLPSVSQVEQPLYPFIQDKKTFDAIRDGVIPIPAHETYLHPDRFKLADFLIRTGV